MGVWTDLPDECFQNPHREKFEVEPSLCLTAEKRIASADSMVKDGSLSSSWSTGNMFICSTHFHHPGSAGVVAEEQPMRHRDSVDLLRRHSAKFRCLDAC